MSGHHSPEEIKKHINVYLAVFASLLVLTVITVAVAYLPLTFAAAVAIALIVASFKGGLVAAIFMHLSNEKALIYQVLLLTVFFFVVVLLIPILSDLNTVGTKVQPPMKSIYAEGHEEGHGDEEDADEAHGEEHAEAH